MGMRLKIAVCIKRVPDMDVRFKIAADGTSVDSAGLKYDINDFDAWAVEAALQLKEKAGQGEVVVISLGPDAAQETLRKALSMGADKAVHLKTEKIPFDSSAIAKTLAEELRPNGYDVILFGKYSGSDIKLDGEEYLIMREDEVLGILDAKPVAAKKAS